MNGWNYNVTEVPEGDARKIVTLERDDMVWVGIRAFHHEQKVWNGDSGDRVVAWRDLPEPASPRYMAVPKEAVEAFEKEMTGTVIPEIEENQRRQAEIAAENRNRIIR